MNQLVELAKQAGSDGLTATQGARFDELDKEIRDLTDKIAESVRQQQKDIQGPFTPISSNRLLSSLEGAASYNPGMRDKAILKREERMTDWGKAQGFIPERGGFDDGPELSFRKWLKGLSTGDWRDAEAERRALSEGTLGAGGYLVPEPLSAQIIDLARNKTRIFEAGATTVPMASETVKIARVADDPDFNWRNENAAVTESDMTLESIEFRARAVAAFVRSSRELLMDATGVEKVLMNAFAEGIAKELDRIALYGTGTAPEPRGLFNQTGVDKTAWEPTARLSPTTTR